MTITYEEVVTAAQALVKERGPDYRYEFPADTSACKYAIDGEPSCIVGVLVNELDPEDFPKLVEFEDRTGISFSFYQHTAINYDQEEEHETPSAEIRSKFSTKALKFLDTAQITQDRGETWEWAVKAGQEIAEGVQE